MGYTHYWTQLRTFTAEEWAEVSADLKEIVVYAIGSADVLLADGAGDRGTHPEFGPDRIMFNGVGDDAHETFGVTRRKQQAAYAGGTPGWDFCKTARKPYDLVVTACLCYLSSITGAFHVTSDGSGADFLAGLAAAREALPRKSNQLDLPMGVMQADRWIAPWVGVDSATGFDVDFCVDGKGYVTRRKTKAKPEAHYCFPTHLDMAKFLDRTKFARFRSGGRAYFGSYGSEEPNIWNATGWFDVARHKRIAGAQRKVLARLFPAPVENDVAPPAYVRPGEMPAPSTQAYYFSDLLKEVA